MKPRQYFPAVLVSLVLGAALAAASPQALLSADSVRFDAGGMASSTALRALWQFTPSTQAVPDGPGPSFEVAAGSLRVETDHTDSYSRTPAGTFAFLPETSRSTHSSATLSSVASRPGRMLHVIPEGDGEGLQAEFGCGLATPTGPSTSFTVGPHVGTRDTLVVDVAGTVSFVPCDVSEVKVRGDFLLVLWEWDAQLASEEGSILLRSGQMRQETLPAAADSRPAYGTADELYIHARNATVWLRDLDGIPPRLFVDQIRLQVAAEVVLKEAAGQIEGAGGSLPVQAQDLRLEGAIDGAVHVDPQDESRLQVVIDEGLSEARVDGSSTQFPVGPAQPPRDWRIVVAVALAAAAGMSAIGLGVLHRRGLRIADDRGFRATIAAGHVLSGDLALEQGHPRRALWHTALAARWGGRHTPESLEVRMEAFNALGLERKAIPLHRAYGRLVRDSRALVVANAIEAAATCCRAGEPGQAMRWLRCAEELDPHQVRSSITRSEFGVLAKEDWVRRLRSGANEGHSPSYS